MCVCGGDVERALWMSNVRSLGGRYCPCLEFNGSPSLSECPVRPRRRREGQRKGGRRSRPALPLLPRPLCRLSTLSVVPVCTIGSSLPLPCHLCRATLTACIVPLPVPHSRGVVESPAASAVSQARIWVYLSYHTPHIVSVNLVDERVVAPARPVCSSECPAVVPPRPRPLDSVELPPPPLSTLLYAFFSALNRGYMA